MAESKAFHAFVHGRVQGVCFRESVRQFAASHALSGWVRNCGDGTVEVHAEASPDQLRLLADFLKMGPPLSKVSGIMTSPAKVEGFCGFEIRY